MTACQNTPPVSAQIGAIEAGELTVLALTEQVRKDIDAHEPRLKAWVELASDIDAQARLVDDATTLPLRGVSVGVKDLIDVAGLPTRAGSSITPADPVATDAACVARLRALGAVIQGKTVTTEFGYFAPGPTRNPHSVDHTPGGSSSGSAAAVGAGTIPLALGTQTAGSLTRPASFCGAAGMVLAHGTTVMDGITGLSESLDSLGLLTRHVDDLRTVYRAFTGQPGHDGGVSRVFLWHGSELDEVSISMCRLLQQLPLMVNNVGIECQPLEWDDHVHTLAADHAIVMGYEAARTRDSEFAHHADAMSAPLRQLLEQGSRISAEDHRDALTRSDRSKHLLEEQLGTGALIVGPAALGPAPAGLAATGSPILSRPWQLLGLPVVVVPGAGTTDGLPLGIQIIGMPGREHDMLDFGIELERSLREVTPIPDGAAA